MQAILLKYHSILLFILIAFVAACSDSSEPTQSQNSQNPPGTQNGPTKPGNPNQPLSIKETSADANGQASITLNLPPETKSFFVNAWRDSLQSAKRSKAKLLLSKIEKDSITINSRTKGSSDLFVQHLIHVPALSTLFVPMIPSAENIVNGGGNVTLTYKTINPNEKLYYQVYTKTDNGTNIDLNVYLVGLDGVTAANAPHDKDLTDMFNELKHIYQSINVHVRNIRFFDASEDTKRKYSIINYDNKQDLPQLLETTQPYGTTLDDALHINIFLIKDILTGNKGGQILGLSGALAGPPGIDGTGGSGIVFSTAKLRKEQSFSFTTVSGAKFTAGIIAHEIGHFLGLKHTTEVDGRIKDVLTDTPECPQVTMKTDTQHCPDFSNLMFPYSPARNSVVLTNQQETIIRLNPLVK